MRDHQWSEGEIFVFGSNLKGWHNGGAALDAKILYGAVQGQGEGLHGQSYAIPTVKIPGVPLTLREVEMAVDRFLTFACEHPEMKFFLTKVGCGLARHKETDIIPLFTEAPSNVRQPPDWV